MGVVTGSPPIPDGVACYANGQVALSGAALRLYRRIDGVFARWAEDRQAIEHQFPPILPASELETIDYLGSFPHLATFPVTLAADEDNVARFVETRGSPDDLRLTRLSPVRDVLTPAACYHFYIHYRDRELAAPLHLTTRATCFRHEGAYTPLERLWSFSMRELVCVGSIDDVQAFLDSLRRTIDGFVAQLGLPIEWATATDPFFRPRQHPKYLAQRLEPVKQELVFDRRLSLASINLHRNYFGEAFRITRDGLPAFSGCVAFGIERWISAIVSAFGPTPERWPAVLA
jgi:hypothetical protein